MPGKLSQGGLGNDPLDTKILTVNLTDLEQWDYEIWFSLTKFLRCGLSMYLKRIRVITNFI